MNFGNILVLWRKLTVKRGMSPRSGSRLSPAGEGGMGAGVGRRFRAGGHVPRPVQSEPEASATAHARGPAGRVTRPRDGNGDADVADASGSGVRDRPQDRPSGSRSGSHAGWGIPAVGQVSHLSCLSGAPPGEGLLNGPQYGPRIS